MLKTDSRYSEGAAPGSGGDASGFSLLVLVALVSLVIVGVLLPNYVTDGHGRSRHKSCIANLQQINSAIEQWAMDHKMNAGTMVALKTLVGSTAYIKTVPTCPTGGAYPTALAVGGNPTCSIGTNGDRDPSNDHTLP
jgi:hypothetical protein